MDRVLLVLTLYFCISVPGADAADHSAANSDIHASPESLPPFLVSEGHYRALSSKSGFVTSLFGLGEPPHSDAWLREGEVLTPLRRNQTPDRAPTKLEVARFGSLTSASLSDLGDSLRIWPELVLRDGRDSFSAGRGLSLRGIGSESTRTLVLSDGIPVNNPIDRTVTWEKLPSFADAQIELVPSAATTVWGDGAAGAIQFLSPPPRLTLALVDEPPAPIRAVWTGGFSILAYAGSFNTRGVVLEATRPVGAKVLQVIAEKRVTSGAPIVGERQAGLIDSGFSDNHNTIAAALTLPIRDGGYAQITLRSFHQTNILGTPKQQSRNREEAVSLKLRRQLRTSVLVSAAIYISSGNSSGEITLPNADRSVETPLFQRVASPYQVSGAAAQALFKEHFSGTTTLGIDASYQGLSAKSRGHRVSDYYTRTYTADGTFFDTSIYAIREQKLDCGARIFPGLRLSASPIADAQARDFDNVGLLTPNDPPAHQRDRPRMAPSLSIAWPLPSSFRLHAAAQRGLQTPTFSARYVTGFDRGRAVMPNPKLLSERAEGYEAGIAWSAVEPQTTTLDWDWGKKHGTISHYESRANLDATVFFNKVSNFIGISTFGAEDLWRNYNLGALQSFGAELMGDWTPTSSFAVRLRAIYSHATLKPSALSPDLSLHEVGGVSPFAASLELVSPLGARTKIIPQLSWSDRRWDDLRNDVRLESALLFHVTIQQEVAEHLTLFCRVANAADVRPKIGRASNGTMMFAQPRCITLAIRGQW